MTSSTLALLLILVSSTADTATVRQAAETKAIQEADWQRIAIDTAIERMKPSLVRIHVVWAEYDSGREIKFEAFGSGAIISSEGHIITNHHVAGRARQIFCTLSDRREMEAELVGTDPLADIAVIKLNSGKGEKFTASVFGDSSLVKVGDTVLAMGSPLALSQSVTKGIVSNADMIQPRSMGPWKFKLEGEDVGSVVSWIGHDAQIFGGNSGGPLVNLKGEIIGVNEISIGLAGAIPGNLAKSVADQLVKNGKVRRAWLGLDVQPLLASYGMKKGVLVDGVLDGSPAQKAGFMPGDILLKLAGNDVNVFFQEQVPVFNLMVMGLDIGGEYIAVVRRDGKEMSLKVRPSEREETRPRPRELQEWGITARNISQVMAAELNRKNRDGVLITSTRPGGPCSEAKPRISEKDVITSVNGSAIKNVEQLSTLTAELLSKSKGKSTHILVGFDRAGEKCLTIVSIGLGKSLEYGIETKKAWLPFSFQVLTPELAEKLGVEGKRGVRITQVYPIKEAIESGLKTGDLVIAFDGAEIPVSQSDDMDLLPAMARQYRINSKVSLGILRGGKELTLSLILPESPPSNRELGRYKNENFEFEARDSSFMDRLNENWPESMKGVIIEDVIMGGWAAIGQLASGDLLVEVNSIKTERVSVLEKVMQEIEREKQAVIVMHVVRGISHYFLEIKPGWRN